MRQLYLALLVLLPIALTRLVRCDIHIGLSCYCISNMTQKVLLKLLRMRNIYNLIPIRFLIILCCAIGFSTSAYGQQPAANLDQLRNGSAAA